MVYQITPTMWDNIAKKGQKLHKVFNLNFKENYCMLLNLQLNFYENLSNYIFCHHRELVKFKKHFNQWFSMGVTGDLKNRKWRIFKKRSFSIEPFHQEIVA